MSRWIAATPAEMEAVGAELAALARPHRALLVSAPLGAGKTVLARGVGTALGIDPHEIQSPTFTVIREHHAVEARLVHVDLYRLEPDDLPSTGLEEILDGPGVKVVEWSERLDFEVPGAIAVTIEVAADGTRRVQIVEPGPVENQLGDRGDRDV